ncbi:MAG: hypothetical protein GY730_10780 [bacterium]|nr:hypothetical protein [bacterium]
MNLKNKRLVFYISTYILIALFAILGLIYNTKAIPINENISQTSQKLSKLKEDNRKLYLELHSRTTLEAIEKYAAITLNMVPAPEIHYLIRESNEY